MKFRKISCILGIAITIIASNTLKANALDFSFSFSNTNGSADGNVTGIIKGLENNQRGEAQEIYLTSYPDDLGPNSAGDLVYRQFPWEPPKSNFFMVENGQIVSASFYALGSESEQLAINYDPFFSIGESNLLSFDNGSVVADANGFSGVTFTPEANALDFTFSFSNTNGSADGNVTGIIKGLENNQRGEAQEIYLTSYPDDLGPNSAGDLVYRQFPWEPPKSNFFMVENGQIVSASFYALGSESEQLAINYDPFFSIGESNLLSFDNGSVVADANGFSGVTFTPISATPVPVAVPFEFSPSLGIVLGLPLFIGLRMLKKRRALKNSTREVQEMIRS